MGTEHYAGDRHPYATLKYAGSFGPPFSLIDNPEWSTFLLERPIPGTDRKDIIGTYPIAAIAPDSDVAGGLLRLKAAGYVSAVLVADPLWRPEQLRIEAAFDVCRPFKTHHLVVPTRPLTYSNGLRRVIRTAQARCSVRLVAVQDCMREWQIVSNVLSERHQIDGIAHFSAAGFENMAGTPGLFASIAEVDGEVVAMTWWLRYRDILYTHLSASSDLGYRVSASYALYAAVIEEFRGLTINLGGCAGLQDDPTDGLWWFKRRFANADATALLCGAVLDQHAYSTLRGAVNDTTYFPAYRAPQGTT
jgi:hypothetical protein